MINLILASNNQHKVQEYQSITGQQFRIITLKEAGIDFDIPEPYDTLEANASEKSRVILEITGMNCFSEDTGLEVRSLNGEPGVKSARFSGPGRSSDKNVEKLLTKMANELNREARFRTIISLRIDGKEQLFDGICEGKIEFTPKGVNGFGYDPVFIPTGSDRTFAEMTLEEKTQFSHRRKACDKLVLFLQQRVS